MSISIPARDFVGAVFRAELAIDRRSPIPALECIRILRSPEGRMIVSGSNTDIRVDATISAEVNGSHFDTLLMAPKALARAISATKAETVEIMIPNPKPSESDPADRKKVPGATEITGNAGIACGDFAFDVPMVAPEDWSAVERSDVTSFTGTIGADAIAAIARAAGVASTEETRYYLQGVYLAPGEGPWGFRAVATDGHRLIRADFTMPDAQGDLATIGPKGGVIVPAPAVRTLLALAKQLKDEPIRFAITKPRLSNEPPKEIDKDPQDLVEFRIGDVRLLARAIDGEYPDYNRVIPSPTSFATFLIADLRQAVTAIGASTVYEDRALAMTLRDGIAELTCRWATFGTAKAKALYEGDIAIKFAFNVHYLLAMLDVFRGHERIRLGITPDGGPITFDSPTDTDCLGVLMPMRA